MQRVTALSHHHPRYLKATYADEHCKHIDHERHIPAGQRYVAWRDGFAVFKMGNNEIPILIGVYQHYKTAKFMATV